MHKMDKITDCLSLDQQIQAGIQKRLLKKANKILVGAGINVKEHQDRIISLMLAETYRNETLTMIRTLEFTINALVNMQHNYSEMADNSYNENRIMYLVKAQATKEIVEFLTMLKKIKEDH